MSAPLCRRQHGIVDERAGSGVRVLQQESKKGAGKLPGGGDQTVLKGE